MSYQLLLVEGDGFSLCRRIRGTGDAPIIFLTARGREADRLYGYEAGCDDYIEKPLEPGEFSQKADQHHGSRPLR